MVLAVMLLVELLFVAMLFGAHLRHGLSSAPHPHRLWPPPLLPWSFVPPEQIVPAVEEFVSGLGCVYSPAVCQAITPPFKLALMPIELFVLADPEYRICDTTCGDSQVRHFSLSLPGEAPFSLSPRSTTLLTESSFSFSHSFL